RCESAEMTSNATVNVPVPALGPTGTITSTPSVLAGPDTVAAVSSSTRTDPPASDTGSLNVNTTSEGSSSTTAPLAGSTSRRIAWALTMPSRGAPATTNP